MPGGWRSSSRSPSASEVPGESPRRTEGASTRHETLAMASAALTLAARGLQTPRNAYPALREAYRRRGTLTRRRERLIDAAERLPGVARGLQAPGNAYRASREALTVAGRATARDESLSRARVSLTRRARGSRGRGNACRTRWGPLAAPGEPCLRLVRLTDGPPAPGVLDSCSTALIPSIVILSEAKDLAAGTSKSRNPLDFEAAPAQVLHFVQDDRTKDIPFGSAPAAAARASALGGGEDGVEAEVEGRGEGQLGDGAAGEVAGVED